MLYSFLYRDLENSGDAQQNLPNHTLTGIMYELRKIKEYYLNAI